VSDSTQETQAHIEKVQARIEEIRNRLAMRAVYHDMSKFAEPEKAILDAKHETLSTLRYGTPEYAAAMAAVDMQPFLEHHYAANDHHPQHYPNGIAGMSYLAVLEMLADWAAAGERTKEGSLAQSLAHNRERFTLSDEQFAMMQHTIEELNW
jgi:hypothetical protein